jgi:mono/diheme cytochrome c family protein
MASAQTLAPGPGEDVVEDNCQNCHGLDHITSAHHDAAGWQSVVNDMISRGASLTEDQEAQVVAYLAAHYGPSASGAAPAPSK